MAPPPIKPNQDSYEMIRDKPSKVMSQVKRAVDDTTKAVITDIRQQITGDLGTGTEQAQQALQAQQAKQVRDDAQQKQQLLLQTRQNLDQINKQISEIRHRKAQQVKQAEQAKQTKKIEKKQEEEKKKADPVWKKFLKGKMGSREAHQRAGG